MCTYNGWLTCAHIMHCTGTCTVTDKWFAAFYYELFAACYELFSAINNRQKTFEKEEEIKNLQEYRFVFHPINECFVAIQMRSWSISFQKTQKEFKWMLWVICGDKTKQNR